MSEGRKPFELFTAENAEYWLQGNVGAKPYISIETANAILNERGKRVVAMGKESRDWMLTGKLKQLWKAHRHEALLIGEREIGDE